MVILYLYDAVNGYRYRHVGYGYHLRVKHSPMIVSAWLVAIDVYGVNGND